MSDTVGRFDELTPDLQDEIIKLINALAAAPTSDAHCENKLLNTLGLAQMAIQQITRRFM